MFDARIVMLAAGSFHSAALASDGVVWTWGWGMNGCLGHGAQEARSRPTRLGNGAFGGSAAVMVECGNRITMVVTADGELWTFGSGGLGRLGHGGYRAQNDSDKSGGVEVQRGQNRHGGGWWRPFLGGDGRR